MTYKVEVKVSEGVDFKEFASRPHRFKTAEAAKYYGSTIAGKWPVILAWRVKDSRGKIIFSTEWGR